MTSPFWNLEANSFLLRNWQEQFWQSCFPESVPILFNIMKDPMNYNEQELRRD